MPYSCFNKLLLVLTFYFSIIINKHSYVNKKSTASLFVGKLEAKIFEIASGIINKRTDFNFG